MNFGGEESRVWGLSAPISAFEVQMEKAERNSLWHLSETPSWRNALSFRILLKLGVKCVACSGIPRLLSLKKKKEIEIQGRKWENAKYGGRDWT